ncbi:MAG: zinc ABC transporter substrate-binding protein [Alphaproteobacteria bacterium]|nr:zinc ABC transporter substrate-binding protein [Alphaproteobacteria bacterium]
MFKFLLFFICLFSSQAYAQSQPKILASIAPIASLIQNITTQETEFLIKTDLHDYQLRPSDRKKIEEAEFFFYGSDNLEIFTKKIQSNKFALDDGKDNPHFWLSINKMIKAGYKIANILGEKYPKQADFYLNNAKKFDSKMSEFLSSHKDILRKDVPYFVFHDAYEPFEQDFGIRSVGCIKVTPHQQSSAKKTAELLKKMDQFPQFCLFIEPETAEKTIQTFIENRTVFITELDPLGTEIIPVNQSFYEKLLTKIFTQITSCFSKIQP